MTHALRSYSGPLDAAQLHEGINKAQHNSLRLIHDAKLLLEHGRYPSATALAILAIEERGKVAVLKRLAIVSEPADLKKTWKDYRSHRAKNAGWIVPELVRDGARTLIAMAPAVDKGAEHTALLDNLKQIAFYTDCLGEAHWSSPDVVIDEALARSIVQSAEWMHGSSEVTLRELELWQLHVRPHYAAPSMANAMLRFQAAMFEEGLTATRPEALAAFMTGRPVDVSAL